MKTRGSRLLIRILILFVALSACLACASLRGTQQTSGTDQKPNRNSTQNSDTSGIPTITYCQLISNPKLYDEKVIRLHAYYRAGFESSYLYGVDCDKDKSPAEQELGQAETWLDFDNTN